MTTINVATDKPIASIEILEQSSFGHVSINPDYSLALVLSDSTEFGTLEFSYRITYADGSRSDATPTFDVVKQEQERGWGSGEHYRLETDANDDTIVETGDNHRKVFISGGDHALTRADIAAREGLDVSKITKAWLVGNAEYGSSADLAVTSDVGMDIWYGTTTYKTTSNWLAFESGYTYSGLDRIIGRGSMGESELHPMHVTSYGEGARPILDSRLFIYQADSDHVVFTDVEFSAGIFVLNGNDMLFDDVRIEGGQAAFQGPDRITIRNSEISYNFRDEPHDGRDTWWAHSDRSQGIYVAASEGLLMEGNIIHHNGWEDGYDGTSAEGQPPSMYSHNVYLQNTTSDVTFRDNLVSQGASYGAQFRGGAYVEDNAFVDNNAAFQVAGGIYDKDGPIGNYSYVASNLVTSGAHKVADMIGGLTLGAGNSAYGTTFIDNIVAHLSDPNNDAEFKQKIWTHAGLNHSKDPYYDDTIVYNWTGSRYTTNRHLDDRNVGGLDQDILNRTTIQNYAREILGRDDATISDLAAHIDGLAGTDLDDTFTADHLIAYFQQGFSVVPEVTLAEVVNRFIPNDRADGFRWDNRANWSDNVLPKGGEDVDLGGNRVKFGGETLTIGTLHLGPQGGVEATSGVLRVLNGIDVGDRGGVLGIDRSGQVWTNGVSGDGALDIDVAGGRFVNTGRIEGNVSLSASDNAEVILGTRDGTFVLGDGDSLTIDGSRVKIGFDGAEGTGITQFLANSTLTFRADATGVSEIREFRSGTFGEADASSAIDLEGARIVLDLTALDTTKSAGSTLKLVSADLLAGHLDLANIEVSGLSDGRDVKIVLNYATDTLTAILSAAGTGTGSVLLETTGTEFGDDAVLDARIEALRSGPVLPTPTDTTPVEPDPVDPTPAEPSLDGAAGFRAEYFVLDSAQSRLSDIDFGATPSHAETIDRISFGLEGDVPFWGQGPMDNFAARMTGELRVETAGSYTFWLTSDDGSKMSLDGQPVIDNDGLHPRLEQKVVLYLASGSVPLEVLYFERGGHQVLALDWSGPDTNDTRTVLDAAHVGQATDNTTPNAPAFAAGFRAEYFVLEGSRSKLSEIDFDAAPSHETSIDRIAFGLGSERNRPFWEGGAVDNFAARMTGELRVEKAGTYTFWLTSDDGSRLFLDGQEAIGNDGLHSKQERAVTLDLGAGPVPIEIFYFERNGQQILALDWSGPDTDGQRKVLDAEHVVHAADAATSLTPNIQGPITGDHINRATTDLDFIFDDGPGRFTNHGLASGIVHMGAGNDAVDNHGAITTIVDLGAGSDAYVAHGTSSVSGVFGGEGDDRITGNATNDVFRGGAGNDILRGGAGDDLLLGDEGDDAIDGEVGDDILRGNDGADSLMGGNGNDILHGGDGDDILIGGAGTDKLYGGSDADVFIFLSVADSEVGAGRDTIVNFQAGIDRIDLTEIFDGRDVSDLGAHLDFSSINGGSLAMIDIDLDGRADMEIAFSIDPSANDFFL